MVIDPVTVVVVILFAIVALAIISWLVVIGMEFIKSNTRMQKLVNVVFLNPTPAKSDVDKSALPVKVVVEGVIPLVFWLLIVLPMIILPVVLILFPLLGIPWSYLLPPVP